MGLDMYLYRKTYVKNWAHDKKKRYTISVKENGVKHANIDFNKISEVTEDVGYWRKSNQIHNWFIRNCADGDGNVTRMDVSKKQLEELLNTVNTVLNSIELVPAKIKNGSHLAKDSSGNTVWEDNLEEGKTIKNPKVAQELLPTGSGFFFGSTEYDEYYYEDLVDIKKILEEVLATSSDSQDFEYYASW